MDYVKMSRTNGYAVVVKYDRYSESPREWDNLSKLFLRTRSVNVQECTEDEMRNARVRVPVYKYEHSGVCLQASMDGNPFSCPWDSCLAGYAVVSADALRKEYGVKRITQKVVDRAIDAVKGEIDTYSQWLNGEVYGFEVYKVDDDVPDDCVCETGELTDSCWGFYGVDDALAEGLENVPKEEAVTA